MTEERRTVPRRFERRLVGREAARKLVRRIRGRDYYRLKRDRPLRDWLGYHFDYTGRDQLDQPVKWKMQLITYIPKTHTVNLRVLSPKLNGSGVVSWSTDAFWDMSREGKLVKA